MSVIPRRVRRAQIHSTPGTDGLPQPDRLPEEAGPGAITS